MTGRETVITVVDPMVVIRSSESGVFRREGGLAHGSRVTRGQLLGTVISPSIEKEHALLLAQREAILRTLLFWDGTSSKDESMEKELAMRLASTEARLANLDRRIADLEVRSPVDGIIQFGVGDYQEVEGDRTAIAQVWPDDSLTLIEIKAPLHVITELIQDGCVKCNLSTAQGQIVVDAEPLDDTLQTFFQDELEGRRKSQWALIRCRPHALPPSANRPGLVGSLQL